MTSEQFHSLLGELARVCGHADPEAFLVHRQLCIEGRQVVLEHNPRHGEDLLQVRMTVGDLPAGAAHLAGAMLDANFMGRGSCVLSLHPDADVVVATTLLRLSSTPTAQDLWQELQQMARACEAFWDSIATANA
ncbi:hypothetical protein [Ramlibacter albus]|uniref:Uncharacterized protein n=1 Tax=Ramlibacter albus TaxID=2079448 RepID=A0A923M7H9_9BURK|nr:hypothetical protein [Ramlibacter albus]MBC5764308.1 hypothetical protein [Ramlibacter albus]